MRPGLQALRGRHGATFGDVALVVATLALLAAVTLPELRRRELAGRVEVVVARVDALRQAAEARRAGSGAWPPTGDPGELAVQGASGGGAGGVEAPDGATAPLLEWRRLERVQLPETPSLPELAPDAEDLQAELPPPPPPVFLQRGAISVHTGDAALLGALLTRYPGSFVHDTVWTLLLPEIVAPQG